MGGRGVQKRAARTAGNRHRPEAATAATGCVKLCSEGWKPPMRLSGSAEKEVHCLCLSPDARFYSTLRPYTNTLLKTGVEHESR